MQQTNARTIATVQEKNAQGKPAAISNAHTTRIAQTAARNAQANVLVRIARTITIPKIARRSRIVLKIAPKGEDKETAQEDNKAVRKTTKASILSILAFVMALGFS